MEIILKEGRQKLTEGRNFGMGFAFAKLTKSGFEGVMPITACRDYLNDVVFTETSGLESSQVYGFKYGSKKDLFLSDGSAILLISVLHYNHGENWYLHGEYLKKLTENRANSELLIKRFMECVDVELDFDVKIIQKDVNLFWVNVPKQFLNNTCGISLLTLLLRVGHYYDGERDIMEFLKGVSKTYFVDNFLTEPLVELVKGRHINRRSLSSVKPIHDYSPKGSGMHSIHNFGILAIKSVKI